MTLTMCVILYVAFGIHFARYAWYKSESASELDAECMLIMAWVWPAALVVAAIETIIENERG